MLPGMNGLDVCRTLRQESDVPIIMLTALTTDDDRLTGLNLGADDYVSKPFSPRELAARVRAVLRRLPGERGPEKLIYGSLTIDFPKHEAYLADKPLNLTPIEFKVLGVLAKEPGRVFSRAQIIENALGQDFESFDRTIDVHILKLRRKLEPDSRHPKYIRTIYGAGYKLMENGSDT
jgi:DNA-binding response OmpR family regulator